MRKYLLLFMFLPFMLAAQKHAFHENITGIDNRSDSLPYFMFEKAEFDSLVMWTTVLPRQADMFGINSYMKIKFNIDGAGNVKNMMLEDQVTKLNPTIEAKDNNAMFEINKSFFDQAKIVLEHTNGLWKVANPADTAKWLYTKITMESQQYDIAARKVNSRGTIQPVMFAGAPMSQAKLKELYNVGVAKLNRGKFLLAANYFQTAISYNPNDLDAYYNLGVCYVRSKLYPEACSAFSAGKQHGDTSIDDLINKYCK